ncbi:hypothetical protein BJ875DRAFT_290512 [Amylocarpus encephaloides]|uniref:Uncharacterized protein n=1 Tax=Amylocarpus encephaloides TaxID=45428 RepID=A0A9P7YJT0_9HELO|nr:hypothetical protein BJ875DRAFT_290512 [Amylocarpus encephaloides]
MQYNPHHQKNNLACLQSAVFVLYCIALYGPRHNYRLLLCGLQPYPSPIHLLSVSIRLLFVCYSSAIRLLFVSYSSPPIGRRCISPASCLFPSLSDLLRPSLDPAGSHPTEIRKLSLFSDSLRRLLVHNYPSVLPLSHRGRQL